MKLRRRLTLLAILALPLLLAALAIALVLLQRQGGLDALRVPVGGGMTLASDPATLARGEYLARLGNCRSCHTVRGGVAYAGGRSFPTPYGTVHSSNLTSDPEHGIGAWSPAEFRHAMRHGVSRNGVLSPVFPYANFAHLTDDDLDALLAHLRTVPPAATTPPDNTLDFPANLPGAMFGWRLLYYRPAPLPQAPDAPADWRRGQYLANAVGHCAMCHGERGTFSSLRDGDAFAGNRLPGWYAPALDRDALQRYTHADLAHYLRAGVAPHSAAYGPMADVIFESLQHLTATDADALATYLQTLPPRPAPKAPRSGLRSTGGNGDALYRQHCVDCHGDDGRGEPGKYPALAGSVSVTAPDPVNAIKVTLFGAMPPSTPLNPRPHTMPPFAQQLSSEEIAAIVNTVRERWGEPARAVTADDVRRLGGIALP